MIGYQSLVGRVRDGFPTAVSIRIVRHVSRVIRFDVPRSSFNSRRLRSAADLISRRIRSGRQRPVRSALFLKRLLVAYDFSIRQEINIMAKGSKKKYTNKQKRKAEHIEEGYEKRGTSKKEAERRAWATVNKKAAAARSRAADAARKKKRLRRRKAARKDGRRKPEGRKEEELRHRANRLAGRYPSEPAAVSQPCAVRPGHQDLL